MGFKELRSAKGMCENVACYRIREVGFFYLSMPGS